MTLSKFKTLALTLLCAGSLIVTSACKAEEDKKASSSSKDVHCEGTVILDMEVVKLKVQRHQGFKVKQKDSQSMPIYRANDYFNYSCEQEVIENVVSLRSGGHEVYYRAEMKPTGYDGVLKDMQNENAEITEHADGVVQVRVKDSRVEYFILPETVATNANGEPVYYRCTVIPDGYKSTAGMSCDASYYANKNLLYIQHVRRTKDTSDKLIAIYKERHQWLLDRIIEADIIK